ncbi:MAG: proton-conducting transporter membrane subunit [Desulfovibrionaceae bacterium]|nr:proton-conducting transporter membrane subunit [Desulfovibrionaceae bacterium]
MEQTFLGSGTFSLLHLLGMLLMVGGAYKAITHKEDVRGLILWGALADVGLLLMGLGAANAMAVTGITLFLVFQFISRALALQGLYILAPAGTELSLTALASAGARKPMAGALFGLGLLAALGGSPFMVPEGRLFIITGIFQAGSWGGMLSMLVMAAVSTIFVWLSVDALATICLKGADDVEKEESRLPVAALGLGLAVVLMGIFRTGLGTMLLALFGGEAAHASYCHPTFMLLYAGAFITALVGWKMPAFRAIVGVLFTAAACAAALVVDCAPVAKLFIVMITVVALIVALYSVGYMAHAKRQGCYWFFLLLTFASLAGIVTSPDMGAMYGYWELMTFASYFLVVHENDVTAHDAGLKYYVMCAGGAFLMLPGLVLLGGGSTALSAVPAAAAALPAWALKAALVMVLVGFAVKAGLVPLHSWLPDAHPAAPSSVSGPLSGIITKMGFFGIVTVILGQAGAASAQLGGFSGMSWIGYGITFMGGLTLIYGEYMALMQDDIKRMLAYSTLGQVGEIALILGIGTWLSTAGALSHVFNHAIMKDLLFLGAGALILRVGSRKLADMRGLGKQMPWTVTCIAIGLISIMGLPPFAGFFSKYLMIQAAVDAGYIWLAALILAGSLVGAIYYTRILKTLVFEERPADLPVVQEAPISMRIALAVLAGACLVLGLAPQLTLALVVPVASACFSPAGNEPLILASLMVPWPVYVAVPIFFCFIPAFFKNNRKLAGWSAVAILLLSAVLVLIFGKDLDTLSFCFALLVPLIGALNMVYAISYMDHSHTQWRFYTSFLCMTGGLMGVASAQYLFSFFLFWEIMSSWTLYMVLAHDGTKLSLREAFKYFMFNVAGAGFIFVGVCVLGAYTPLSAALIFRAVPAMPSWVAFLGFALLAIGFVMKAAQLPFRIDWQMHPAVAPTPVSGYISSVLLKSAILGLVKLFMLLGGGFALANVLAVEQQQIISTIVMWIGGITIIMAAVRAMLANQLKLVFIYSTVSQIGYMVLAVAAGSALGYAGGLLHVINHVFFKDLLFLICGAIMFQTHRDDLDSLGGLGRKMPFTLTMFAIAGLSVVGVPPTSGFTSKWIIYHALMQAGQPFLALLSLLGSLITLAYIAKFLHAAFLGQASTELGDDVQEAPLLMRIPMGILGVGCVLTGLFPGLALYPINTILVEYGVRPLEIGMAGIVTGPGAWNATGVAVMAAIAFVAAWKFVTHFVNANNRLIDVHSCGLPVETAVSRMSPSSIYGGISQILRGSASKEN